MTEEIIKLGRSAITQVTLEPFPQARPAALLVLVKVCARHSF